jgi:hypothetical protein
VEEGLSKVDAWHLFNVVFRLYKVVATCYDLCNLYITQKVILIEKWEDQDKEISNFYLKPQHYGYGENVNVQLSSRTFEELYRFIIEQNDFALALDLIQPKLHLNHLVQTMQTIEEFKGIKFSSTDFIASLSDFRTEIYKWAAVYSSRMNSTIDKEMAKREVMTFSLLCDDKRRDCILREDSGIYKAPGNDSFEFSNYFISEYNGQSISRIYQYLNYLNTQKGSLYISKVASVIAIAWENHLLCDTYNNTLQAVFNHFGITDKIDNYKPARLRRSNYKGTIPMARAQAMKFFQSIDNRIFTH